MMACSFAKTRIEGGRGGKESQTKPVWLVVTACYDSQRCKENENSHEEALNVNNTKSKNEKKKYTEPDWQLFDQLLH